ncbi:hypothetical protein FC093_20490 [Ilyomonas limi]|uniref:TonB C-terminal domain-containing protein n=1 Tax=Ilyomonas limi TaxID=2575867 RepID=A0A4V5UUV3_9BACT|nr:energy transducer TonB [Ilyomonas limi]TKK65203.1 hypothetical protein FC093_20490 [Ilyomonas limi]
MKLILLKLFLILSITGYCQYYTIKGRVFDVSGNVVSYATIKSMKTGVSFCSDKEGFFTFQTPYKHDTLICNHISFQKQTEILSGNDTINFFLIPNIPSYFIETKTDNLNTIDSEDSDLIKRWYKDDSVKDYYCPKDILIEIPAKYSYRNKREDLDKDFKRIYDSLTYPHFDGTIKVGLLIDKKGILENIRLIKGISNTIDTVVINTLKMMHPWHPAIQAGRNVEFYVELEIEYKEL